MIDIRLKEKILLYIKTYESPTRVALSRKYPFLKSFIILVRHFFRNLQNFFNLNITYQKNDTYFSHVVARHQSLLRRKLGVSDPKLQEQKIQNLKQAIKKLDGIVIKPGKIFSFWQVVGQPKYKDGYVDGMLISNGNVIEGLGGGMCQLSNFLYWIFLHAPTEIMERHHHSKDVFPDSGRTLPFGSGATIFYNYLDLKVKNVSNFSLQIKIWLTDDHLKGQILSNGKVLENFHIVEKNHLFVKKGLNYFRYNEIYREVFVEGKLQKTEEVTTNFAPVLYEISDDYLKENNFAVCNIDV
ncbi:MAG: VanW family protein [Candidatus Magasanikbacteria bacterium]